MKTKPQPAGYVLLSVLLLTALIASLVMTYSRHALLSADSSAAGIATQQAQDAADTGFAWAKQSLRANRGSLARMDLGDGRSVSVNVGSGAGNLRSIDVNATTDGSSQSVQATFEVYPVAGDDLPELTAAAKLAVPASTPLIIVNGTKNYSSTELTGILYLRSGATLNLTDVILDGAIVSEAAVTGATGGVRINLLGGVQIQPGAVLPGCAIIAPDAALAGSGSERIQIHGAIIADVVSFTGSGAIHGAVASSSAPVLGAGIDRPGYGRAPLAWPSSIQTNASGVGRLAFSASDVTQGERDAIRGYHFPVRRTGQIAPTGP